MATIRDAIEIAINADGARARKEFESVGASARKNLGATEDHSKKMAARFTSAGAGMVVAAGAIGVGLLHAAGAAESAKLEHEKLANTMANMPQLVGASTAAFEDQQKAIQSLTVVDDEAVAGIQSLLGQFGQTQDQIIGLTPLVVDLARKMGVDTATAAKAVGKALDGSAGSLKKMGISADVAKGSADNFTNVMDAMRGSVGGFAQTEGKTFSGQLTILKNQLADLEEGIGVGVVDAISGLLGPVQGVSKSISEMDPAVQSAIGKFLTFGTAALGVVGSLSFVAGKARDVRDNFTTMGADGTRSLTKMGKAASILGAAGAAAGILAVGIELIGKGAKESGKSVDELAQAVSAGASVGTVFNDELADVLATNKELVGTLDRAGVSQVEFADAVTQGGKAFKDTKQKLDAYNSSFDDLGNANLQGQTLRTIGVLEDERAKFEAVVAQIKSNKAANRELAGAQRDLTSAVDLSAESFGSYSDANSAAASAAADSAQKAEQSAQSKVTELVATKQISAALADEIIARRTALDGTVDYVGAAGDAAKAADEQKNAVVPLTRAWDRNTAALQKNIDGQQKVRDAQRDSITSVLDYEDSLADLTQKQKDYNAAVAEHGRRSPEAQQAYRDLQRAVIGVQTSLEGASQAQVAAAATAAGYVVGQNNSKDAAEKFRAKLAELQAKFPALRDEIQRYIDKINAIPASHNTVVTVNGQQTVLQPDGTFQVGGSTYRAAGGPVERGAPYIVGEKGPELFVPGASGTIIPNDRLTAARSRRGGGEGSVVVNMNVTVSNPDPNAVVRALDDAFAKNGSRILRRWALTA